MGLENCRDVHPFSGQESVAHIYTPITIFGPFPERHRNLANTKLSQPQTRRLMKINLEGDRHGNRVVNARGRCKGHKISDQKLTMTVAAPFDQGQG